jgi:hypothetical protein
MSAFTSGSVTVQLAPGSVADATRGFPVYSASIFGLVPAASATDIFTITGSATKRVRVQRVVVNGSQTTAGRVAVGLVKRSTANTGGSSTAPAPVGFDSTSPAASATVLAYTANATTGTLSGFEDSASVTFGTATSTEATTGYSWSASSGVAKPITLRGITEVLAVNLNAATVTGGLLNVTIQWTEE